ncbi:MAG: hypothetical protein GX458_20125 [Phyllobacteriaceae bacterium]|nr:hypothetical protein [Phyllobacteriaceae bacterium]
MITFAIALGVIWVPVATFLVTAPPSFESQVGLILPGAGASTSINLSEIGQATSSAPPAYASSSLSPTVTYKNLLLSDVVLDRAATTLRVPTPSIGKPVIKLVDETSLIRFTMKGRTPAEAFDRARAVLEAFQGALDTLRDDEIRRRQHSTTDAVGQYAESVRSIRSRIGELQVASGLNSTTQYDGMVAAAETLRARLVEARAAWEDAAGAVDALVASLGIKPDVAAKTIRLHADPEFNALMASVGKAAAETAEFGARFGPRHPVMMAARARLDGATAQALRRAITLTGLPETALIREIDRSASGNRGELLSKLITLAADRDGKASEMQSLKADYERAETRVRTLLEPATRLGSLDRDYKIAEAVFASALARIDTVKADVFASYPMTQILEPPTRPEAPSRLRQLLAVVGGLAATGCFGLGLFLAWMRHGIIDRLIDLRRRPEATAREPVGDAGLLPA